MALGDLKMNSSSKPFKGATARNQTCVRNSKSGDQLVTARTPAIGNGSARSHCVDSLNLVESLLYQSHSIPERVSRIQRLLLEIKKEKPFCECSLYTMPLSFRSFVWTPMLEDLYQMVSQPAPEKTVHSTPSSKPTLQRSRSAHSIQSSTSVKPLRDNEESPDPTSIIPRVARKDIVRMNALSATRAAIKLKNQVKTNSLPINSSENGGTNRSHKLGVVPKYLTNRKEEWAREEERRLNSLPDPNCPPGHVMIPETERLETLSHLERSQVELIEELNGLPVSKDTMRIRQRKEEIEKQLIKVDEGIRIFSKSKVFVKVDH